MNELINFLLQTTIMLPLVFSGGNGTSATQAQALTSPVSVTVTLTMTDIEKIDAGPVEETVDAAGNKVKVPIYKVKDLRRMAVRLKDFGGPNRGWTVPDYWGEQTYTNGGDATCTRRWFDGPYEDESHNWETQQYLLSEVCLYKTEAAAMEDFQSYLLWEVRNGYSRQRQYGPYVAYSETTAADTLDSFGLKRYWYRTRVGKVTFTLEHHKLNQTQWGQLAICELATLRRLTNFDAPGICNFD